MLSLVLNAANKCISFASAAGAPCARGSEGCETFVLLRRQRLTLLFFNSKPDDGSARRRGVTGLWISASSLTTLVPERCGRQMHPVCAAHACLRAPHRHDARMRTARALSIRC
eukprot:6186852-Pleurochrysis_carterae.AAC.2